MSSTQIELNPVDFITVGTIGPKGQRIFHLQGGKSNQLVSMIIEKEQALALSQAVKEMLEDLESRRPTAEASAPLSFGGVDMDLREPIEPVFRVSQMGLGYDEDTDMVVLVAQEMVVLNETDDPSEIEPGVVRLWCSRQQMRMLSEHTLEIVKAGRPDYKQNGRIAYYWT
ncbi:MAG: DUF3090 family protein [Anaerolineae bacterium]|nr:DUF3090 family protein [Anaerolineae bacterium]